MHALLKDRGAGTSLNGKKILCIALGDERYRYLCNSAVHMEEFVNSHGGELIGTTLKIINEPYGQEEKIETWGNKILPLLS